MPKKVHTKHTKAIAKDIGKRTVSLTEPLEDILTEYNLYPATANKYREGVRCYLLDIQKNPDKKLPQHRLEELMPRMTAKVCRRCKSEIMSEFGI